MNGLRGYTMGYTPKVELQQYNSGTFALKISPICVTLRGYRETKPGEITLYAPSGLLEYQTIKIKEEEDSCLFGFIKENLPLLY